jgi:hypothetical protein
MSEPLMTLEGGHVTWYVERVAMKAPDGEPLMTSGLVSLPIEQARAFAKWVLRETGKLPEYRK